LKNKTSSPTNPQPGFYVVNAFMGDSFFSFYGVHDEQQVDYSHRQPYSPHYFQRKVVCRQPCNQEYNAYYYKSRGRDYETRFLRFVHGASFFFILTYKKGKYPWVNPWFSAKTVNTLLLTGYSDRGII
jgi:hypothetical protein